MVRILACADVHLGRRSAGLPADLAASLTPAAAWERLVQRAVRERVTALLVCGDLVDESNAYFEALAPLERAAEALAEAGTALVVIAGNHDWDVLERLAASTSLPIRVLGRGGRWGHLDLAGSAGERLRLFGWSYPERAVTASPLAAFPVQDVLPGAVNLALLHADLEACGGRYCPVSRAALTALPVDGWLLGHRHLPSAAPAPGAGPFVLYAGSLQGLDTGPGERGSHGVWSIEAGPGGTRVDWLPLAAVQYDDLVISLDGVADSGALQIHLAEALRRHLAAARAVSPGLSCAVLRLCLRGRTALSRAAIAAQLEALQESPDVGGAVRCGVTSWSVRTLPPLDMALLRRSQTPLGAACRLWEDLAGEGPLGASAQRAVEALQERLGAYAARACPGLEASPPALAVCRDLLSERTERLIEALVAQKEPRHG